MTVLSKAKDSSAGLCNRPSVYPHEGALATDVVVQVGGLRPKLHLHHGSGSDEQLVLDQQQGISIAKAQELAERALHVA